MNNREHIRCLFHAPVMLLVCAIHFFVSPADAAKTDKQPRNFLRNGSFEAGWCNELARELSPHDCALMDHTWITDETAFHGKYCLKIPVAKPFYWTAVPMNCFTLPVKLPGQGLYTISLHAKAVEGEQKVTITGKYPCTAGSPENPGIKRHPIPGATATATVNTEKWTPLEISVPAGDKPVYLFINAQNVYIDAIEFLRGEAPKLMGNPGDEDTGDIDVASLLGDDTLADKGEDSFVPAAPVECGICDEYPGHTHYHEEGVTFPVRYYNSTTTPQKATLRYELLNQNRGTVIEGTLDPVKLEPGQHACNQWKLPEIGNGKYSLKYWIEDHENAWGEHVFVVMPKPVPGLKAPDGVLAYLAPPVIDMMTRAGMYYYAALDDNIRIQDNYNLKTGKLEDLSFITRWGTDAGMTLCMDIQPAWWPIHHTRPWQQRMPSRHPSESPDPETYRDAVDQAARIYGPYCKVWWIQDELEGHYHPHEFAPVFEETVELVRKHRPDAEFMISAMGSWVDQFYRVNGLTNLTWLGGSVMGQGGDLGRKLGWLVRRHNMKFWATAGSFTFFHPFSRLRGGTVHASWNLHHGLITSVFLHNAKVTMMYRGAPYCYDWTMVHDPYNVFEADLSMTCGLSLYAIAGQILAGAETQPDPIDVEGLHGGLVWGFIDGRTKQPAVCFFPGAKRTVIIDIPAEQLRFTDQLGNPIEIKSSGDGSEIIPLNQQFCFLYASDIGANDFFEKIRIAKTDPPAGTLPDIEDFACVVTDSDNCIEIEQLTVNRGDTEWTGDRYHPEFNDKPLAPGTMHSNNVPLPNPYRERYPIKPVKVRNSCYVWLSTARRCLTPPSIDADLAEWEPISSSALYFSNYVLGAIDLTTIHSYKDSFKILCDHGMDYRLEWFTAYDDANLYFCARVFDDQLISADMPECPDNPDCVELRFDRDLTGDLMKPSPDDDVSVWLTPDKNGTELRVEIEGSDGKRIPLAAKAAVRIWDDAEMLQGWEPWKHPAPHIGYMIEAAIPWKELNMKPAAGKIIGFDVFGHETDTFNGQVESSILRWAGRANPTGHLRLGNDSIKPSIAK